jgi:predicted nicotinamide N-methyase
MTYTSPTSDDRALWDLHLSGFAFPAVTAADELGIFDDLAVAPAAADEVAARLNLNRRAIRALLPILASSGFLVQRLGRYHVTDTAKDFLLRASPFYWGPVFALMRQMPQVHESVRIALKQPEDPAKWDSTAMAKPSNAWSDGQVSLEMATSIAAYMHANCLAAALVAAQRVDLSATQRLLDVGAGSGCFSIAFAQANPKLHCTIMDLPSMCEIATGYTRAAGVEARVDTRAVDMFRQDWPHGYDAILFSNIFHDWDFETCKALAARAYSALPSGGRILLHEMLLDDSHDGPPTATAFSLYMLLGTKGQQFTAAELARIVTEAGFTNPRVIPCHGYFSVLSAEKP